MVFHKNLFKDKYFIDYLVQYIDQITGKTLLRSQIFSPETPETSSTKYIMDQILLLLTKEINRCGYHNVFARSDIFLINKKIISKNPNYELNHYIAEMMDALEYFDTNSIAELLVKKIRLEYINYLAKEIVGEMEISEQSENNLLHNIDFFFNEFMDVINKYLL